MKARINFLLTLTALALAGMFQPAAAQSWEGRWEGVVNVGVKLRVVFRIQHEQGKYSASFDSPDQAVKDIFCDSIRISGDSIFIRIPAIGAHYLGSMGSDNIIRGELTQRMSYPLVLEKKEAIAPHRPQKPLPPFPYTSRDVIYYNQDSSMHYGATLTIPQGQGPFPAVVLVSGSGSQDRNSTVLGHPIFEVLADHLTRNGIAVLRYDDRGVGETSGIPGQGTSADFADDAEAGIEYLRTLSQVDKKRLGIIGHSEGGMIAPMIANRRNDINFLVLLAAPSVPIVELMAAQNEAIARSSGLPAETAKELGQLFREISSCISRAPSDSAARAEALAFMEQWASENKPAMRISLNLGTEMKRREYALAMTEQLRHPWFLYFLAYDPGPALQKLKGRVLALNGSHDLQVIASQNLPAIRAALEKSGVEKFEVKELENLNHLFQTCVRCTLDEYGELEETFSPAALEIISNWIIKKTD